ncbi:hypothetical protein [Caulobacter segnis]|uniref:Uncharacterized protein n=1 Tax=Caulobacter segnis TaxID=88688 RepID=A0A2W5X6G6_9CAUL|nr:hypothetical protein [Caulobacter segnis]PZR36464.1 MAG: hypothetical protein DI526_03230 [Caulobacter segnis]
MSIPSLERQGWKAYTPATLALCKAKVAEANRIGRQDHGARWAPDMLPCGMACPSCQREVAAQLARA